MESRYLEGLLWFSYTTLPPDREQFPTFAPLSFAHFTKKESMNLPSRPVASQDESLRDLEGEETLEGLESAHAYNRWMYETIRPYVQNPVLEIGSGIGNITTFFVQEKYQITGSDLRPHYLDRLRSKFDQFPCQAIDAVANDFDSKHESLKQKFGTVFALNVVEHIAQDALAIRNLTSLLKPGGSLVILVPANQWLYNDFDLHLGHFKRYNKTSLNSIILEAGLKIQTTFYFNVVGIAGWFVSGRTTRKKTIPKGHIKLYNLLVPIFRLMDAIVLRKAGLSVICVAHKPN